MSRGYYTISHITDYGPYVTKIILPLPAKVQAVAADAFTVYVQRLDPKGEPLLLPKSWMALDDKELSQGYVPVTAAYPCGLDGVPACEGDCVALDMAYGPSNQLSSMISAPEGLNVYVNMRYTITQNKPLESQGGTLTGLTFDFPLGHSVPDQAGWLNDASRYEPEPIHYGYFIPQNVEPGPRPLLIWLHGAGEGGVDPTVAYTGNKVVALSSPKVQKLFGGAYVLAPQTKTFWMNDGSGEYGHTGRSMYSEALKACILEFLDRNPGIDRNRVYIGGDSNGGFMTMRMLIDYPELFAAAFPVCEALYDDTIREEDIARIQEKPIWFTHAKNDPVVKPQETVEATYKRLMAAGAQNVHFTFWDKIEDIHEGFKGPDGEPFEYLGHFAWIPMLNDDCRVDYDGQPVQWQGREVSLLEWLAEQKKD
ncbi:prolyl oligopeptidase family serine peptidase [Oscillospiraceae bacterium 42-9]